MATTHVHWVSGDSSATFLSGRLSVFGPKSLTSDTGDVAVGIDVDREQAIRLRDALTTYVSQEEAEPESGGAPSRESA